MTDTSKTQETAKSKGPTKEQLDAWKKENPGALDLEINHKGKKYRVILKKVQDRNIYAAVLSFVNANKMLEAGEMILANCTLYADPEVATIEAVNAAAAMAAYKAFELPEVAVKNL